MTSVKEFLDEVDAVFGFYLDFGMASASTLDLLDLLSRKLPTRMGDESTFTFRSGPPTGTPEEEIKRGLHNTTYGELKKRLSKDGKNLQVAANAAIVFIYQLWEEKYRGKIAGRDGVGIELSDIMGDVRLLRNSIIHNKGIAKADTVKCKVFTKFKPGDAIAILQTDVVGIIEAIRAEFSSK